MSTPEVRPGDALLKHTPWMPVSWLIRALTKSHWNHTAWVTGPDEVTESVFTGVRRVPLSHFHLEDPNLVIVRRVKAEYMSAEKAAEVARDIRAKKGRGYDFLLDFRLLGLIIRRLRKRVPAESFDTRLNCTELGVESYFRVAGFWFNDRVPVVNVVPGDIANSDRAETIRAV